MLKIVMIAVIMVFFSTVTTLTAESSTNEQDQQLSELRTELAQTEKDIRAANQNHQQLADGPLKALVAARLETLKANREFIQQWIRSLESGTRPDVRPDSHKANLLRAAEIKKQIFEQRETISHITSDTGADTLAAAQNALARLEQQYLIARYGMAIPAPSQTENAGSKNTAILNTSDIPAGKCVEVGSFNSAITDRNRTSVQLSWKADIRNSCSTQHKVHVRFVISDRDNLELNSDEQTISIPANTVGKARGVILVSPPERAGRIAKQAVRTSIE